MPTLISELDLAFYRKYSRPIVHLRQQLRRRRLGLVLGAGVSRSLGFPDWDELVTSIISDPAAHLPETLSAHLSAVPPTTRIQVAFEQFRANRKSMSLDGPHRYASGKTDEVEIRTEWRRIIRRCLYKNSKLTEDVGFDDFLLLMGIAELTQKDIDLVVTYNFDDLLERAVQFSQQKSIKSLRNNLPLRSEISLGYQTIWSMSTQHDPDNPTIYHPNGYISHRAQELQSDSIVFSDEEFRLTDTKFVWRVFFTHTFLFSKHMSVYRFVVS